MTAELVTLLGDTTVGRLARDRHGRLSFSYDAAWRQSPHAYPISLSMPLALVEHGHRIVDSYVWGLLPDNELIIERWAKRFQVSARSAFALMAHVGEDCAGAIRFVAPDKVASVTRRGADTVQWLTEKDVAERLRDLHRDASAWRRESDSGQFSLGGAQPKTALLFDGRRWGVPSGRSATTHILKPGVPGLDGHAENEHFCLTLAADLGLPVARSRVARFDGEVAIVVERYDRVVTPAGAVRVHQEDVCQALGVAPALKYEADGGPGARAIVDLLREHSRSVEEDVDGLVQALILNWVIGGTDAHAKNYSILIGGEGRARLAPLYDVASALPYGETSAQKLKLAMKVGGKYRLRDIGPHQWAKLATELKLETDRVMEHLRRMVGAIPDLSMNVLERIQRDGLAHPVLRRLAVALSRRAKECGVAA
jgi:serine/threonine-protein kinase HipA